MQLRLVLIVATLSLSASCLFLGPSTILHLPHQFWICAIGLVGLGISTSFIYCYTVPELIKCSVERYPENEAIINDYSPAMFNMFVGVGSLSAPLLGSWLEQKYGFATTCDTIALTNLAVAMLYAMSTDCL